MHIAIGITLRHLATGERCKITNLFGNAVHMVSDADDETTGCKLENMAEQFEEFGPLYERVDPKSFEVTQVQLSRCPFCGSTNLDPAGWMSDADLNNTGPTCDDCGASHESVDRWNARYQPPRAIGQPPELAGNYNGELTQDAPGSVLKVPALGAKFQRLQQNRGTTWTVVGVTHEVSASPQSMVVMEDDMGGGVSLPLSKLHSLYKEIS